MKTHDLETNLPALVPEVVADLVTLEPEVAALLAARARSRWATSRSFRESFRHRDERDVMYAWMRHWNDGITATGRREP